MELDKELRKFTKLRNNYDTQKTLIMEFLGLSDYNHLINNIIYYDYQWRVKYKLNPNMDIEIHIFMGDLKIVKQYFLIKLDKEYIYAIDFLNQCLVIFSKDKQIVQLKELYGRE